jgi:PadR family transcriptional regulator PadR
MKEINEQEKKFQKELNSGTTALVLLSIMDKAEDPMYGYQIAKLLEAKTEDTDIVKGGALYPVLRSLEASGLLQSEVEPSVAGPPRRYYTITAAGRDTLGKWIDLWQRTRELVDAVLEGDDHDK